MNGQWELCQYSKGKVVEVLETGTALKDGLHDDVEYPNGDKYSGPFQAGKMNGSDGKMIYKDGRIFIGDWKDGKRHGYGKMKFPDGRKFDGAKTMIFAFKTRNFVSKTRSCVSKTSNFVFI